jgi:CubicO group peptidase (beta-lactamase class C family)
MNSDNNSWPLPWAEPEEVGISSERLSRIKPVLQQYIDDGHAPNFATMVIRRGKIVHFEAQGYMDIERKKPVRKDTIYRMYSNSKTIDGAAIMICVEDGLLSLDDPISKYIPAFKNPVVRVLDAPRSQEKGVVSATRGISTVSANREVTIRDCLRNTTGFATASNSPFQYRTAFKDVLPDGNWFAAIGPESIGAPPRLSLEEEMEAQARLPLAYQPGTHFEYHIGYPVIRRILEVATGKTLGEFEEERFFKPLGMKDTTYSLPDDKLDQYSTCYRPEPVANKWKLVVHELPETSGKLVGPVTRGVLSTAPDFARFGQMLLNGGELDGVRILGRKTVELMTADHLPEGIYNTNSGQGFGFGMGVGVYKGRVPPIMRSIGAFGWSGFGGTIMWMDPQEELIWLCFSQILQHNAIPGVHAFREVFERLVYQSLK